MTYEVQRKNDHPRQLKRLVNVIYEHTNIYDILVARLVQWTCKGFSN